MNFRGFGHGALEGIERNVGASRDGRTVSLVLMATVAYGDQRLDVGHDL